MTTDTSEWPSSTEHRRGQAVDEDAEDRGKVGVGVHQRIGESLEFSSSQETGHVGTGVDSTRAMDSRAVRPALVLDVKRPTFEGHHPFRGEMSC